MGTRKEDVYKKWKLKSVAVTATKLKIGLNT